MLREALRSAERLQRGPDHLVDFLEETEEKAG